jgi:hypothetical protein
MGDRFQSSGSDRGKTAAGLPDDFHQIGNNPGLLFQLSLFSWGFQACLDRGGIATIAPCCGTKKPHAGKTGPNPCRKLWRN